MYDARVRHPSRGPAMPADGSSLPPGQRRVDGFPRFGTHLHHPAPEIPADPAIEIRGAVTEPFSVPLARLATLQRREQTADFHCVAGWSATGVRWEGVRFATFYREVIEPALAPGKAVTHLGFGGLDGYRSFVTIEDALADDVLIAEQLEGRPLDSDHGAPARLVSPSQYGFISTKHLCLVEVRSAPPSKTFGRTPLIQAHPRARVWKEERHSYLPARALRHVYRLLIPPFMFLSARGSRKDADGDA
jgi:DMSO/TMAO reductase YedYZ molybdopterin-dependent catalytic subunit